MDALLAALEALPPVAALRASFVAYPLVNAAHIASVGALVTCILLMDLRILGTLRSVPAPAFTALMRKIGIGMFLLAVTTGVALFSIRAREYVENPAFLVKLGLLLAAGLNLLLFHTQSGRPSVAKVSAALSILLWPAILLAGRFIGFV